MGASLWDQVWRPLLISVVIAVVVAALRFLSVRFWNCLMKLIEAVGERAPDHRLLDSGRDSVVAAHANGETDVETGTGNDPAGVESVTVPQLELVYRGEGIEHSSVQESAHTPVIQSPVTTPQAQVATDAAGGALVPAEMDVPPHSQKEEVAAE